MTEEMAKRYLDTALCPCDRVADPTGAEKAKKVSAAWARLVEAAGSQKKALAVAGAAYEARKGG